MDQAKKLELIDRQIADAGDGTPGDFSVWRQTTGVVLRATVGDTSPLYRGFEEIRYGLRMWTENTPQSAWDRAQKGGVLEAVAILKAARTEVELTGGTPEPAENTPTGGKQVFIVHGHSEARKHEVARLVAALTKNDPVILHERANEGRSILEKFEAYAADAGYAIAIATADDVGRAATDSDERPRARQNVVFETGFFFGALGRERVALLYDETVERPSDLDGIVRIALDAGGGWKLQLARELSAAGIGIDWSALR